MDNRIKLIKDTGCIIESTVPNKKQQSPWPDKEERLQKF